MRTMMGDDMQMRGLGAGGKGCDWLRNATPKVSITKSKTAMQQLEINHATTGQKRARCRIRERKHMLLTSRHYGIDGKEVFGWIEGVLMEMGWLVDYKLGGSRESRWGERWRRERGEVVYIGRWTRDGRAGSGQVAAAQQQPK
jgi:hypothetical protein